jgi:uncharacterized membrane protein (DUF4010 family)
MSELEILQRLVLATSVGLLFGIERGWQQRAQKDGDRVAGIRTYTLIGLCGGVCGLLAAKQGGLFLGFAFLALAGGFVLYELRRMRSSGNFSATGLVTALLTFALGAYGAQGSIMATGAAAVLAALVLVERRILHGFLRQLTWLEIRAALLLLVMTVVLLPVLPDRPIDPLGVINPHEIWLMTVMIAAVSFAGYVAMRLSGARRGLLYAGFMGGLVTSTTVTWTFARLARRHAGMTAEVAAAIFAAWLVSLLRIGAIAFVVTDRLLPALGFPIAVAAMALLAPLAICYLRAGHKSEKAALPLANPFALTEVFRLGGLFAVILLASRVASSWFGEAGVSTLGAVSGFLDVDPITVSMARMVRDGAVPAFGASVILLAALSNGIAKTVLGFAFGGWRLGSVLLAGFSTAALAGGVVFFFTR